MNRFIRHLSAFYVVLLLCSCAAPQKTEVQRIFWPPAPDKPRFEWVGHFATDLDLKEDKSISWYSKFIGDDTTVSLSSPLSVVSDGKGNVYVSDAEMASVYRFDFNAKTVSKFGGKAYDGVFKHVNGLAVDAAGNAYASDSATQKIYVATPESMPIKVIDVSEHVEQIGKFAIDNINRHIVIPDLRKHRIVVTDMDGKLVTSFGSKGAADGEFNLPVAVAIEKDGGIIVGDSLNARIQRFTSMGVFVNTFGKRGDGLGDFSLIKGVAVDSEGHIYATDGKEHRVSIYSSKGEFLMSIGGMFAQTAGTRTAAAGFLVPQGISIDQNDRIYVADQRNKRFQVFQFINERYRSEFPIAVNKGVK